MTPLRTARLVGPDGPIRAAIANTLRESGLDVAATARLPERLDLGVFIPTTGRSGPLSAMSPADWSSCVDQILTPAFRCAKELTPRLARSTGALVFVSSLLGEIGAPNQTAFSAAAAGIIGFVKALTVDVPTVRFSAVAPAFPIPDELWSGADVDWHANSASLAAHRARCRGRRRPSRSAGPGSARSSSSQGSAPTYVKPRDLTGMLRYEGTKSERTRMVTKD